MRKFEFGIWNFGFRKALGITKFEFRNSKSEIARPVNGTEGFTLIEVILVIVLVASLVGILIPPFRQAVEGFVTVQNRAELTSKAREATTRMVREIRNIEKNADNTPDITGADATSMTFADAEDNSIRYYFSAGAVRREDINLAADNILVDKVSSLQFRYFDGSNAELSPPLSGVDLDNVRRILVVLTLQQGGETVMVTDQAFLRGLTGL